MNKTIVLIALLVSVAAKGSDRSEVMALVKKNSLSPDKRVISAILSASKWYGINPLDLTAIGILETGLGKYNQDVYNLNGTVDTGIFQINTINRAKCSKFDLNTIEGSAYCAAKLLSQIKHKYQSKDPEWIGIYHSKTKSHKDKYFKKITQVMAQSSE